MQIAAVISSAAWTMDWEHEVTDKSEEVACVAICCGATDSAQDGAHDLPVGRAAAQVQPSRLADRLDRLIAPSDLFMPMRSFEPSVPLPNR